MSTSHTGGRGGEYPAMALAVLLVVHTLIVVWPFAVNSAAVDFFTFWSVPHTRAALPAVNIYSPDGQRAIFSALTNQVQTGGAGPSHRRATSMMRELYGDRVDVTGSPLLYTLVAGISTGSFEADGPRYMAWSFGALCLSVLLLCLLLGFGAVATLLLLALVASNFSPVISDVTVGNVNTLQLLAVSVFVFCWARNKPALAGVAIGAGAIVKPTIALVVVLATAALLAHRDTRRALRFGAGVVGSAILGIAASAAYFGGFGIWIDFIRSLGRTLSPGTYTIENGNFSGVSLLFGSSGTTTGLVLLVGLTLAGIWLAVRRSGSVRPDDLRRDAFFAAGWGAGIILLTSPLVWLHYYVLLLPAILGAIDSARTGGAGQTRGTWAMRAAGFAPLVLLSASAETLMGDNHAGEAALVNLAAVVSLTMLAVGVWSGRRPVAEAAPSGNRRARSGRPS